MKRFWVVPFCLMLFAADSNTSLEERLWRFRNLGKAFYENPTTQVQAVDEFKKALDLAPTSARERLNYGLSLLRAGKTKEGVDELLKVQKQDPQLPHTWFNLGIVYRKDGDVEKATPQFERMIQLVPNEPISHYNLGALYKQAGQIDKAQQQFARAAGLDPNLAAPHFQLYNVYRQQGKKRRLRNWRNSSAKRSCRKARLHRKIWSGPTTPRSTIPLTSKQATSQDRDRASLYRRAKPGNSP